MSTCYLALFDDPEYSVETGRLRAALERDWPSLVLEPPRPTPASPVRDVVWAYRRGEARLEGYSHVSGTCIYLEGDVGLAAEFALWYRGLVPSAIELVFCDEAYTFTAVVRSDSTVEALVTRAEGTTG